MNFNATPRKRPAPGEPGSTPFSSSKFQSSLVPMSRPTPSRSYHPPKNKNKNKPTGFSSNTRDLFRTSTPQANRTSTFSPDLPPAAIKATPSARKFVTQKNVGAGMSSAASADLFKMRIPSPDPELTGEILSKQVPDDPNRAGTIYADQYLAHRCPTHFDELQRRQFFCILDLRRLKYAANEIFVKKDWKLNILNFAKEYEKSRGLILLRYGLYEFKKVKPSAEVLKRWRAAHGLPAQESEDQKTESIDNSSTSRTPGTATKRKADDDLGLKDNALATSTANQNKRRIMDQETTDPFVSGPAPFKKSKRKVDETDEPDENQPSKLQKQPSSMAKSKFESILDKAQSATSSPLKRPPPSTPSTPFGARETTTPASLFAVQKPSAPQLTDSVSKPDLFAAVKSDPQSGSSLFGSKPTNGNSTSESVLAGHKPGSTLTTSTGMFGYLSGSSANTSGNEKEDADDDDESESGSEQGIESQDTAPSYEPSAVATSTGTSTPPAQNGSALFSSTKFGGTNTPLSGLSHKPAEANTKGGLFDRVKLGADGQPMRATLGSEEKEMPVPEVSTPVVEPSKTPARTPGDFRFNAATTPINFSKPNPVSTPANSSPFTPVTTSDPPKESPKTEDTPTMKTPSIFGFTNKTAPTTETVVAKPLFGETKNTSGIFQPKPSESASSIFGTQKSADAHSRPSTSPTKPTFGNTFENKTEHKTWGAQEQPKNLFDKPSTNTAGGMFTEMFKKAAEPQSTDSKEQPKSLFGTQSPSTTPRIIEKQAIPKPLGTQDQPKILFNTSTNGASQFQSSKRGFENSQKPNGLETSEPSTKKLMFGGDKPATALFGARSSANSPASSTGFTFGAANSQPAANSIFNNFKTEATNGTNGTTQGAKSIFAATTSSTSASDISKPAIAAPASLFGNPSVGNDTTSPFSFNAGQPAPIEQKQNGSANISNIFGNNTASSGPSFEFKASSPAPITPAGSFEFKASSPAPGVPAGRRIATPKRRLGTPGATGSHTPNTSFNTGALAQQPQLSASFSFGGNGPSAGSAASSFGGENSNGGFNFTFGGNGQSASNPFAPSNGQAPLFGNNASIPSASTTFNTSFDTQMPSTPSTAPSSQSTGIFGGLSNGANNPSFNFHPPTPQQNASNIFASKPTGLFGNNLQPSGDGNMGASE